MVSCLKGLWSFLACSFFLFAMLLCFDLPALAEDSPTVVPIRTLEKITDDLFRYQYAHHVSLILNTPEGLLITDPSSREAMVALKVELDARFKKPVRFMIYSHHHADHIGGAAVFAGEGTTIVAHEDTQKILAAETVETAKLPLPHKTFKEHMILSFGGKTIELFPVTPKTHAEGMIAMRFVEDRTLFAVDIVVIEGMAWMNLNNTRFPAHIDTIKNLEVLEFDHFASGHYRMGTKKDMREHREFLEDLRDAVQAAIDAGLSLVEAKRTIRLDKYSHFFLYDEWMSFNVEGAYRQLKSPEYGAHVAVERVVTPHEDPNNTVEIVTMCAFCHGADGIGLAPNFPNLAGQKYDYLVQSIREYRARTRYESNMSDIWLYISDEEVPGIAKYYSELNSNEMVERVKEAEVSLHKYHLEITPRPSPNNLVLFTPDPNLEQGVKRTDAEVAALIAAGKELAIECAACHGMDGIGTEPIYPNLAGQKELYLSIQLRAMKYGERDIPSMKPFVDTLSETDIDALAAYFASLPVVRE